jgi:hypothetical protein
MMSNIRHLQLHNTLLETKRHGLVIVNVPNPFGAIPLTACPFNTALQVSFLEFNSQSDNGWLLRRRPSGFSNNDFDGGEAFAPLLAVAIADPRPTARHNGRGISLRLSDRESVPVEPA